MLYLSNSKHTLLEKIEQIGNNGKTYYVAKFNNNEGSYVRYNCSKELFERLEEKKQYTLCIDHKTKYNKDTNTVNQFLNLTEVF